MNGYKGSKFALMPPVVAILVLRTRLFIWAEKTWELTGFEIRSSAPQSKMRVTSDDELVADKTRIGTLLNCRICLHTSSPFRSGWLRSRITISGKSNLTRSILPGTWLDIMIVKSSVSKEPVTDSNKTKSLSMINTEIVIFPGYWLSRF